MQNARLMNSDTLSQGRPASSGHCRPLRDCADLRDGGMPPPNVMFAKQCPQKGSRGGGLEMRVRNRRQGHPQGLNDLLLQPWASLCPASSVEVCNHVAFRAQSEHIRSTFGATIGSHSEHAKNGTLLFHALEEGLGTFNLESRRCYQMLVITMIRMSSDCSSECAPNVL